MSLDFYLNDVTDDSSECCACKARQPVQVFKKNITHNLTDMAVDAGIYKLLWHPERIDVSKAHQVIDPLRAAITSMVNDPSRFSKHNPENGWGSYDSFLRACHDILEACEKYPTATINTGT